MNNASYTLALVALLTLVGCGPTRTPISPPPDDPVRLTLYSTTATAPLLHGLMTAYEDRVPTVDLQLETANHEALFHQLQTGEVPYFISHHLPDDTTQFWAAPIAQDALILITHPDNPVKNITLEDARRMYQGFITDWASLGGDEAPIELLSRDEGASIRLEFERLVMGQRRISPNAVFVPSSQAALSEVRQSRYAVAYIPFSHLPPDLIPLRIDGFEPTPQTIQAHHYPLRLWVYVIGQQTPQGPYADFIAWVQGPEGQAHVLENRFMALPN